MKLKNVSIDDVNVNVDKKIEVFLCNKKDKNVSLVFSDREDLSRFIEELEYLRNWQKDMTSF